MVAYVKYLNPVQNAVNNEKIVHTTQASTTLYFIKNSLSILMFLSVIN